MSYKFKTGESFAKGLRRIATDQCEKAGACLVADEDVHKVVHEVRKSIKRLRALLRLYRGSAREDELARIDIGLRDMGRSLSSTRELQGMLDSIAALEERFGAAAIVGPLTRLRAELEAKQAAETDTGAVRDRGEALGQQFAGIATAIAGLELSRDDFDAICEGLEHTYRQARHWHERAYADAGPGKASDETFHEWRKNIQRHWRHMQLLTVAWPQELKMRASLCHAIGETIGRDHDLAVLEACLGASGRRYGPVAKIRAARQMCQTLQEELRESVRLDGERLFLERAGAFGGRLERYWRLARRERRVESPDVEATSKGTKA